MYDCSMQLLLVVIHCQWTQPEVFSATSDMEPLLLTQQRIINDVKEYIDLERKRLLTLKKREHKKAMEDIPDYLGNPIAAFTLIKRLTTDIDLIRKNIQNTPDNAKDIMTNHEDLTYPNWEDLSGAALGISRLQEVYKLDTRALSEGTIKDVLCSSPMTVDDCFELGRTLYDERDYEAALSWLTEALRKYNKHSELYQLREIDIVEYITASHLHLGDLNTAFDLAKQQLMIDPKDARAANLTIHVAKLIAEQEVVEMIQDLTGKVEDTNSEELSDEVIHYLMDMEKYEPLCRGDLEVPSEIEKSLHCEYMTRNDPFLKIAPFKVEYKYLKPDIVVFHDVMSDAEIDFLQNTGRARFQRAKVYNSQLEPSASKLRISKSAWLRDVESVVGARVSRRVADMTALSMDTAEDLQIANYGPGGYYTPHYDFNTRNHFGFDERIATVLFYMSDVEQGGATVFPTLGVRVVPRKGTALFWLNLLPTGEGDRATRHAACPVLRGSKWVSTKWVHQLGQELLKPCRLEYQDTRRFPAISK